MPPASLSAKPLTRPGPEHGQDASEQPDGAERGSRRATAARERTARSRGRGARRRPPEPRGPARRLRRAIGPSGIGAAEDARQALLPGGRDDGVDARRPR